MTAASASTVASTNRQEQILTPTRPRILGWIWVCLLAISLLSSAHNSYQSAIRVDEYAYACDPFGYLNMAKQIRQAARNKELPQFWIESPQNRLLINFLASRHLPVLLWHDLVGPLAYIYYPQSGRTGVQYPPGTGLVLSLFPEGKAVVRLNKTVVALFLVTGIVGLILCGLKRAWISAGFLTLVSFLGLQIIGRIGGWSFSINAVLIPLLLTLLFAFLTLWFDGEPKLSKLSWLWSLLSGLFFGLAILIRLPVVFLAPGLVVFFLAKSWRISVVRLSAFGLGMFLTGLLPLFAFQHHETGAWYLPTYGPWDARPPSLQPVRANIGFYLGHGAGSTDNWALLLAVIGLTGFLAYRKLTSTDGRSWKHLVTSVVVLWCVPTAYFLTHEIVIPYYAVPASFGTVGLITICVLLLERKGTDVQDDSSKSFHKHGRLNHLILVVALLPGLITLICSYMPSYRFTISGNRPTRHSLLLPQQLADDRSWIWADFLTGTFWYYANKPAFKITTINSETRALVYRFVFERGDQQYLVNDSPYMPAIMKEISEMGGQLDPIPGGIEGSPYFRVRWPQSGPVLPGHTQMLDVAASKQ